MKRWHGLLAIFALLPWTAWAGNAAWYRWESRIDAHLVCAQTSPGEGWTRIAGPYSNASCTRPR